MMQRQLFGDIHTESGDAAVNVTSHHRCRRTDPATSHESANETESRATMLQGLFLAELRRASEPLTANEVAHRAAADRPDVMPESVRKRAGELVKDGRIVVAVTRRCTVTGRNARTFSEVNH